VSATFRARPLVGGRASGPALVSSRAFTFAHGVDPGTGSVSDIHSDLRGRSVKGAVIFYPFGKGSTTASSWFLEAVRLGNGPAAVVTDSLDLSMVIGSVLAKTVYQKTIPVLTSPDPALRKALKQGGRVEVDGTTGTVVLR
jgi:predicted aconitase with swiveling domain